MELMSSLLLFALTLLPQTLGKSKGKFSYEVGLNNSTSDKHKSSQNILFNISPPMGKVSDLQSVFIDASCRNCISCMERAIKAHKVPNYVIEVKPGDDIESKNQLRRNKRRADDSRTTVKKSKSKKNKLITVFKYVSRDDDVYAIKVKESSSNSDNNITRLETKCEVYKVLQFYPCESPEANAILKGPKIIRNSKKGQIKDSHSGATTNHPVTSQYKKRQIEEQPEHFMSSVEETMY